MRAAGVRTSSAIHGRSASRPALRRQGQARQGTRWAAVQASCQHRRHQQPRSTPALAGRAHARTWLRVVGCRAGMGTVNAVPACTPRGKGQASSGGPSPYGSTGVAAGLQGAAPAVRGQKHAPPPAPPAPHLGRICSIPGCTRRARCTGSGRTAGGGEGRRHWGRHSAARSRRQRAAGGHAEPSHSSRSPQVSHACMPACLPAPSPARPLSPPRIAARSCCPPSLQADGAGPWRRALWVPAPADIPAGRCHPDSLCPNTALRPCVPALAPSRDPPARSDVHRAPTHHPQSSRTRGAGPPRCTTPPAQTAAPVRLLPRPWRYRCPACWAGSTGPWGGPAAPAGCLRGGGGAGCSTAGIQRGAERGAGARHAAALLCGAAVGRRPQPVAAGELLQPLRT